MACFLLFYLSESCYYTSSNSNAINLPRGVGHHHGAGASRDVESLSPVRKGLTGSTDWLDTNYPLVNIQKTMENHHF